jgi:hypothetical protein
MTAYSDGQIFVPDLNGRKMGTALAGITTSPLYTPLLTIEDLFHLPSEKLNEEYVGRIITSRYAHHSAYGLVSEDKGLTVYGDELAWQKDGAAMRDNTYLKLRRRPGLVLMKGNPKNPCDVKAILRLDSLIEAEGTLVAVKSANHPMTKSRADDIATGMMRLRNLIDSPKYKLLLFETAEAQDDHTYVTQLYTDLRRHGNVELCPMPLEETSAHIYEIARDAMANYAKCANQGIIPNNRSAEVIKLPWTRAA